MSDQKTQNPDGQKQAWVRLAIFAAIKTFEWISNHT